MSALPVTEITVVAKAGRQPLTKILALNGDGTIHADRSRCTLASGTASRALITGGAEFAALLARLKPHEAIILGKLRDDLAAKVKVGTAQRRPEGAITRSREFIDYCGGPGWALIDVDYKGAPPDVLARVAELGGPFPALCSVVAGLAAAERVSRASTSAGLYHVIEGDEYPTSGGEHHFLLLTDTSDVAAFLRALQERCWLHGLAWHLIAANGSLLERSLVDIHVAGGERLTYEAPAILHWPLAQDAKARQPIVHTGVAIDPLTVIPRVSTDDHARIKAAIDASRKTLQAEADGVRAAFNLRIAKEIVNRRSIAMSAALQLAECRHRGTLCPYDELVFSEFGPVLGEDVLADPDRYMGKALADPDEGPNYGRTTATVLAMRGNAVFINSHAHGGNRHYLLQPWVADDFKHIRIEPPELEPESPPTRIDGNFWLRRTLTAPVALLGDFMTSSTRGFFGGVTGSGKTMVCMSAGVAMACGRGFLHWAAPPRPLIVLYIDGEMPRDLVQERIRDIHRRMGQPDLSNFHCLCKEDFEDMPPLNTPEGQRFLIAWIEKLKPDFVFLDSRMCLIAGDLKDEQVWATVMPLVLWLTKQRIGHLWLDHTGHAVDHIYGSKVKEWTADLVALLEDLEAERVRLGAGVCVRLTFTKARRRNPAKNGADFASGVITLIGDTWNWTPDVNKPAGKVPDWCRAYYAALLTVLGTGTSITVPTWRDECERKDYIEPADEDETASQRSKRFSKFRAAKSELARQGIISVIDDNFVFCAKTVR